MKLAAANAIAEIIGPDELHPDYIIPSVFDRRVGEAVARKSKRRPTNRAWRRRERCDQRFDVLNLYCVTDFSIAMFSTKILLIRLFGLRIETSSFTI